METQYSSPLVEDLVARGLLQREQAEKSGLFSVAGGPVDRSGGDRLLFHRKLITSTRLTASQLADIVSQRSGIRRVYLEDMLAGESFAAHFVKPFLMSAGVFPFADVSGTHILAMVDPDDHAARSAVALTLQSAIEVRIASIDEIEALLLRASEWAQPAQTGEASDTDGDVRDAERLRDLASGAPVVRAVDEIFERATNLRATDIHFEPLQGRYQIRLRVDGLLRDLAAPAGVALRALVSRIKILSSLNIAEHRVPQDGRMRIKVRSREYDVRVAIMPTAHGEAAILRLLNRDGGLAQFDQLNLNTRDARVLRDKMAQPHGLIIITGPTGSGKTTTLAAMLTELNTTSRKILSIEDPIEYELPGVNQTQVRPAVGLTFATALRAFLRQDPDVIMVGEMRDGETASICIQAALTGHLVLSTLHTNSAASAVTRLMDMGIEPFLLASVLRTVVAQRLIRLLCVDCRARTELGPETLDRYPRLADHGVVPGMVMSIAVGCERCGGTGYRGRRAIFEVIEVDDTIHDLVLRRSDDHAITDAAKGAGTRPMIADGLDCVFNHTTSLDEVLRVATVG